MNIRKTIKTRKTEPITPKEFDYGIVHREMLSAANPLYWMWTDELDFAIHTRLRTVIKAIDQTLSNAVYVDFCSWVTTETNIEELSKWLEAGGWELVDGDAVDRCLVIAALAFGHRTMFAGSPRGETPFPSPGELGAPYSAFYGIPRAEQHSPQATEKVAAFQKVIATQFKHSGAPATEAFRPTLFGLDALKADFKNRELWGLYGMLPQEVPEGHPAIDPGPEGDWLMLIVEAWVNDALNRIMRNQEPSPAREVTTTL